jgi:hypothetical protein
VRQRGAFLPQVASAYLKKNMCPEAVPHPLLGIANPQIQGTLTMPLGMNSSSESEGLQGHDRSNARNGDSALN